MDIEFKVGDEIIDCLGNVGFVRDTCKCDKCKERGFFEPIIEPVGSNDGIYITDYDRNNGFKSYYKIGSRIFIEHINQEEVMRYIKEKRSLIKQTEYEIDRLQWILAQKNYEKSK